MRKHLQISRINNVRIESFNVYFNVINYAQLPNPPDQHRVYKTSTLNVHVYISEFHHSQPYCPRFATLPYNARVLLSQEINNCFEFETKIINENTLGLLM